MARDERLIKCCRKGCLDALQTLVLVEGVDPHARNGEAFCHACDAGHLHIAQWLRDQPGFDLPSYGNKAFVWACGTKHGNPAVAQWLWSIMADEGLRPDLKLAFATACTWRNLAVAKWIVSVAADVKDLGIHKDDDDLIRRAVVLGCTIMIGIVPPRSRALGLARWLLSLDPQWPSWPAWAMDRLKVWSPARDAWMRSCVVAAQAPTKS
jgi:hypothetical protein